MLDKLKEIQVHMNVDENVLELTHGVVKRWWSTYMMIYCMLKLKSHIRQLYYEELDDETRTDVSVLDKCCLTKDDCGTLENVQHVLEPFKEGKKICKAHKYVTLSLVPIFIKTIHQELMVLDEDTKEENKASPFLPGSNKATLWSLVLRMLINFKQRSGTGEAGMFLNENVDRGKGNMQKGMKKTHHVSFTMLGVKPGTARRPDLGS
jgi:hypothetical protein